MMRGINVSGQQMRPTLSATHELRHSLYLQNQSLPPSDMCRLGPPRVFLSLFVNHASSLYLFKQMFH